MQYNTDDVEKQPLEDVSSTGKQRPWKEKKMNNEILSRVYEEVDERKAERLKKCAEWLEFTVSPDGSKKLTRANFCKVRLCPMCSWRRSLKIFSHVNSIMNEMNKENYAYIFATFTVKNVNGNDLDKTITQMMKAWNRLVGYKDFENVIKGWYRGLEVTHNTNYKSKDYDTYHPHFHVVLVVRPSYFKKAGYLKQSDWTSLWKQAMELDYTPLVDVRRIKGNTAKAVCEVAKYTVKDSDYIVPDDLDLSVETVRILDKALAKRRLVAFGGIMKKLHKQLNLDDELDGDLVRSGEEEIEDAEEKMKVYYTWNVGYGNYYKINGLPETKY